MGISPIAQTGITGFALTGAGAFATSPLVNDTVTAADQISPTPSELTTAIGNMETAYTDAVSMFPIAVVSSEGVGLVWSAAVTVPFTSGLVVKAPALVSAKPVMPV